jgi:hypothetical protein
MMDVIWNDAHNINFTRNWQTPDHPARKVEHGVTPTEVMASMAGIDFLRAMFAGRPTG